MHSRTREWAIERAGETAMRPGQTDNREPLHIQARLRLFRSLFSALTLNSWLTVFPGSIYPDGKAFWDPIRAQGNLLPIVHSQLC
jgi:hypothetical protein